MLTVAAAALLSCGPGEGSPPAPVAPITAPGPAATTGVADAAPPPPPPIDAAPDITELYPYPLDDISREVAPRGRVRCPDVELVTYRGDVIRYHKRLRVYRGFVDKLRRFEEIVRDTAVEIYGRAPRRIVHLGSFYCRRIRAWPTYVSEHGLGNAIDVEGFDFPSISRRKAPDLPAALRRSLRIRVEKHWSSDGAHGQFLRTLAQRLIEEEGLFRVMLGPAEPGHHNHFHFDVAPWRIVNIFEDAASSVDPG